MSIRCLICAIVCVSTLADPAAASIDLQLVASGLDSLVDIQHADDGSGRLFLALQGGKILIYDGTQVRSTPCLDLTSRTVLSGERGLLGPAFHPNYASNGFFYVNHTDSDESSHHHIIDIATSR